MIKVFKCDKMCTVSDREVVCDRCGKKTKYLCDVRDAEEREILIKNLQQTRIKQITKK